MLAFGVPAPKLPAKSVPKPSLGSIVLAAVACLVLARVPALAPIAFPLRLLTTFVHESGHALATLLTGGRVLAITIQPDGSGLTTTQGGIRPVILSAGYLGSTLVGCALLLASRSRKRATGLLWLLGAAVGLLTVLYAHNPLTWIMGAFWGLALLFWAAQGPKESHPFVLAVLGIQGSLNALSDLLALVTMSAGSDATTDASLMSHQMFWGLLPPFFWAVLWASFSVLATALTLRRLLRV